MSGRGKEENKQLQLYKEVTGFEEDHWRREGRKILGSRCLLPLCLIRERKLFGV